jgi:hypothetical protein
VAEGTPADATGREVPICGQLGFVPGDGVGLLGPEFISGFGRIVQDAEAGNEAVKAARASSVKMSLP